MNSMTGFGKAELATKLGTFTVEVSTVNNRFLEISTKLPRAFAVLDSRMRELVGGFLSRGKVYIYVGFEEKDTAPGRYPINGRAAEAYLRQLEVLRKKLKLPGNIEMRDLLLLPEIASSAAIAIDEELVWSAMERAARRALKALVAMRQREGRAMAQDMAARLKAMAKTVKKIEKDSDGSVQRHRDKLKERLEQLLEDPPDSVRLEEEIAIMAERADISEECTRLVSHIDQFSGSLKAKGAVGKRLNFLLQEMNREANTIGSKCSELSITRCAISLKEEIERIREQVQNVE